MWTVVRILFSLVGGLFLVVLGATLIYVVLA